MIIESIREELMSINPDAVLFDNPSFDRSIIGLTDCNAVVYDFEDMIKELCDDAGMSELQAQEFIEYNTLRTIPYINDYTPVIVYPINKEE